MEDVEVLINDKEVSDLYGTIVKKLKSRDIKI